MYSTKIYVLLEELKYRTINIVLAVIIGGLILILSDLSIADHVLNLLIKEQEKYHSLSEYISTHYYNPNLKKNLDYNFFYFYPEQEFNFNLYSIFGRIYTTTVIYLLSVTCPIVIYNLFIFVKPALFYHEVRHMLKITSIFVIILICSALISVIIVKKLIIQTHVLTQINNVGSYPNYDFALILELFFEYQFKLMVVALLYLILVLVFKKSSIVYFKIKFLYTIIIFFTFYTLPVNMILVILLFNLFFVETITLKLVKSFNFYYTY
uniref:Uncharacterized protein n=1 Tax=Pharyngomonas kirbyi TaxID=63601 RepID=A0A1W6R2A3_9EUKA|nr:hypothetical protein [Pharyngomonas kirbyi]ARO48010.1 hypothetical protein [Pharyngomonas kirbyi]